MRVGFLFNHYFTHQIPQAAPCAFELSRKYPELEVVIACSSEQEMAFVKAIGALYPEQKCGVQLLSVPLYYKLIDPLVSKWAFGRKKIVLRHNLLFFKGLDALVSPERNCLQLRSRFALKDLVMIHIRHGAGDRQGGFDHKSGAFDLTLLPGQKYVDRLKELGMLTHERYAVIGWPKFEVISKLKQELPRFFDNDRPVVVYNPHFDQTVSSWRTSGLEVLDFFLHNKEYNLIFAPHVVLFKRSKRHKSSLPKRYYAVPNIHIDTGSSASGDMTYMLAADIYLGDVSSQVYEFLVKPRPCVFVNGHTIDWQDNPFYLHWRLGQVVKNVKPELGVALDQAFKTHPHYLPHQQDLFRYTYYSDLQTTAAERGADAIAAFLKAR